MTENSVYVKPAAISNLCNALTHNHALLSRDLELHVSKILCDKYNIICCKRQCDDCDDGIGATIKRRADSHVAHGGSIKQINDLIEVLSESKIIVKTVSCTLCSF
jgi:hypothetical protein